MCDDMIHRFSASKNPMLRQAMTLALSNKNTILSQISGAVQNVAGATRNRQLVHFSNSKLTSLRGSGWDVVDVNVTFSGEFCSHH